MEVTLPNGMVVQAPNRREALSLYHELFEAQVYFPGSDLQVNDGDCVMDVGANIGLFSLSLASRLKDLRLFAFEPIGETFRMLQQNVARYAGQSDIQTHNIGLSNYRGEALFTYDPSWTVLATSHPRDVTYTASNDAERIAWVRALIRDQAMLGTIPGPVAKALLTATGSQRVSRLGLTAARLWRPLYHRRRNSRVRSVTCQMRTVSEVMRECALTAIDLLKIDVEGGELDVLRGIDDHDWPKVRQLTLEVHDIDDRLNAVLRLLQSQGYATLVTSSDFETHKLAGVYMVCARLTHVPSARRA